MKASSLIAAILLFIAVLHMPFGYYKFMRIGVTIASLYLISQEVKKGVNTWVILFSIIAIIFNPILPIYLGSKSTWMPIDIIAGAFFLIFAFTKKENNEK